VVDGKLAPASFPKPDEKTGVWTRRTVYGTPNILVDRMVQPYVMRPLLITKRKFHMRLYVVVGSWHPLQVYLYREGLALFASLPYKADSESSGDVMKENQLMHLTNSAVNLGAGTSDDTMWTLARLKEKLGEELFQKTWREVHKSMTHLFCNWDLLRTDRLRKGSEDPSQTLDATTHLQKSCFDLYGLDVIVRDDLVPVIMEINKMPSLAVQSKVHKEVKVPLVRDIARTIVRPLLLSRPEDKGGVPLDATFTREIDKFLDTCGGEDAPPKSPGPPGYSRPCELSDAARRALWALDLQIRQLPTSNFDLVYPHATDLSKYSRQCQQLGSRSPMEDLHLDLLAYRAELLGSVSPWGV